MKEISMKRRRSISGPHTHSHARAVHKLKKKGGQLLRPQVRVFCQGLLLTGTLEGHSLTLQRIFRHPMVREDVEE